MRFSGYIEGYYGRILNWTERHNIIEFLHLNNLNTYFYCPKEDVNQRFKWKEKHNRKWLKNFSKFNKHALGKNINVIAGISPGLDFNFKSYI